MTPENFCYWLQGMLEIVDPKSLDEKQIAVIKDHLSLVLNKITPDRYDASVGDLICESDSKEACENSDEMSELDEAEFKEKLKRSAEWRAKVKNDIRVSFDGMGLLSSLPTRYC